MDCPVGATAPACPGTSGAGPGGFTLGDMGKVIGYFQVHADGEIWSETLWDLRRALGATTARGARHRRAAPGAEQPVVPRDARRDHPGRPGARRRRTTTSCGRCSPTAGWASARSPRAPTRGRRRRPSTRRRCSPSRRDDHRPGARRRRGRRRRAGRDAADRRRAARSLGRAGDRRERHAQHDHGRGDRHRSPPRRGRTSPPARPTPARRPSRSRSRPVSPAARRSR